MKFFTASVLSSSVVIGLVLAACNGGSETGSTVGNGGGTGTGATSGSGGGGTSSTGGSTSTGGTSATGGTSSGPCTPGQTQCSGNVPQTCDASGTWTSGSACQFACSAGACTGECVPGAGQCNGQTPQTCDATGKWVDGTPCQYSCTAGQCTGSCTPGEVKCKLNIPQTCASDGTWQNGSACPNGCENGVCKEVCKAGEFHCEGNDVMQCDPGPPAQWVPKSPALKCNFQSGQKCDAKTGTCVTAPVTGGTTPTGEYFQYGVFCTTASTGCTATGVFKGGYDVDSFEDNIYVNRSGQYLDHYKVELLDSDGDGKLEPDQHPKNPLNTGPIEQRVLKFIATYSKATDGVPLANASTSELYALSDRIFSLGPTDNNGMITEWFFSTKTTNVVLQPATGYNIAQMGFGDADGLWYGSNESNRRVYSWHAASKSWVMEFNYPNLAGSHMDGLEVIVSPKTGEQYVYVSDMTSDFLGQYRRDATAQGGWVQENLFKYTDNTGRPVEGMGFGALNHFWATGGTVLYEIGGGDLAQYLE